MITYYNIGGIIVKNSPKIGLALSSGAERGLAHIGVLKALDENNINIDYIAGSSAGALIGSIYCCGIRPYFIERLAEEIDRSLWVDLAVPRRGFIKGEKIEELVNSLTRGRNIEDLEKSLAIVATDLITSKKHVFCRGPIYKAVRASISIPGIFIPLKLDNMILVDGAVTERVPDCTVKGMGADIVISSDVGYGSSSNRLNHVFDVLMQSFDVMSKYSINNYKNCSDIIIKPDLSNTKPMRFDNVKESVQVGYNATMEEIGNIKSLIKDFKNINKKME